MKDLYLGIVYPLNWIILRNFIAGTKFSIGLVICVVGA